MSSSQHEDPKLGQIVIEQKLATTQQVAEAMLIQKETELKSGQKLKLGQILVFMKVLTLEQLQNALRGQTNKAQAVKTQSNSSKEFWNEAKSARDSFIKFKKSKLASGEESGFMTSLRKIFKKT